MQDGELAGAGGGGVGGEGMRCLDIHTYLQLKAEFSTE